MASNSLHYGDNLDILRRCVQDESSRALVLVVFHKSAAPSTCILLLALYYMSVLVFHQRNRAGILVFHPNFGA